MVRVAVSRQDRVRIAALSLRRRQGAPVWPRLSRELAGCASTLTTSPRACSSAKGHARPGAWPPVDL